MRTRPGRRLPDALRISYARRVTEPSGAETVVRATRKEDVDVVGEATWWMPWPIYVAGQFIRELRTCGKYDGLWQVTVRPRWGFKEPELLGEFSKADALDLVDTTAIEIARRNSK